MEQCTGRTFQFALGGAGDPNKHEKFESILRAAADYKVIPNLTTSGFEITSEEISLISKFCGAAAVSYYSRLDEHNDETNPMTVTAIKRLIAAVIVFLILTIVQLVINIASSLSADSATNGDPNSVWTCAKAILNGDAGTAGQK